MPTLSDTPLAAFACALRDKLRLRLLIETGSASSYWAALHFSRVISVDANPYDQLSSVQTCALLHNAQFHYGDPHHVLHDLLFSIGEPALFWLADDELQRCPALLLSDLEAIFGTRRTLAHAVLIDGASRFTTHMAGGPPIYWIKTAAAHAGYLFGVAHDVIALVPPIADDELYAFKKTNLAYADKARPRFAGNLLHLIRGKAPFVVQATMQQQES